VPADGLITLFFSGHCTFNGQWQQEQKTNQTQTPFCLWASVFLLPTFASIMIIWSGVVFRLYIYFFFLAPNDPDDDDRYGGCPFSLGWGTGDRGSGIEVRGSVAWLQQLIETTMIMMVANR